MTITAVTQFPHITVELDELADDLALTFKAGFYEDEQGSKPATSIVYTGETYFVVLEWELTGKLAAHFSGKWLAKVDLESVGVAQEFSFPPVYVDMDPCKTGPYKLVFPVTPDTVKPAKGGTVYLVAATLASEDPCGKPGHLWAYGEGVSVMFVEGKPD